MAQPLAKKPHSLKHHRALQYFDGQIEYPAPYNPTLPIVYPQAAVFINRSAPIVSDGEKYYVAVARLVASIAIPRWLPQMSAQGLGPTGDGVSLIYTCTIVVGGTAYPSATMQLPYGATDVQHPNTNEEAFANFYAAFWSANEVVQAVNSMINRAWANALVPVGTNPPFFSFNSQSQLYSVTAYPFNDWVQTTPPNGYPPNLPTNPSLQIWFNQACYPLLDGFDIYQANSAGQVPAANGCDIQLQFINMGTNYNPQPAGALVLEPAAPNTTSLTATQSAPTYLPSINTLRLQSSIPSNPEAVPGEGGNTYSSVLTDFKLSQNIVGPVTVSYNRDIGDARWIRVTGTSAIYSVNFFLQVVNWLGGVSPLYLYGAGDECSIKLVFAPANLVENYEMLD